MVGLEYLEGTRKIILEIINMNSRNKLSNIIFLVSTVLFFAACNEKIKGIPVTDTPISGTIEISVDESFEPVIKEQIAMYEASYPGTKINAHYKTESECLKDFFKDSATRLVIVTRGLTDTEEKFMIGSVGYNPAWQEIATDAVAIIVNKKSVDTFYTLNELQQTLQGKINKNKTIVFDGLKKTSTVRFIQDSVLKGMPVDTSIVRAVKNSDEVLAYVASHENAIGFVGINRIGNPEDSAQVEMLNKVKIALIQCDLCQYKPFILPTQQSILNRRYPLVRGLHYIVKENYKGLGTGFVTFLQYERGQLIFRRAYLGPIMNFNTRNVNLNEKLPKD
jgi:phosphate transport system substrate-binding protein